MPSKIGSHKLLDAMRLVGQHQAQQKAEGRLYRRQQAREAGVPLKVAILKRQTFGINHCLEMTTSELSAWFPLIPTDHIEAGYYLYRQAKRKTTAWGRFIAAQQEGFRKMSSRDWVTIRYEVHDADWMHEYHVTRTDPHYRKAA